MAVFRKLDAIYWKGKKQPWRVRLLFRYPWLQQLQWWHVLLSVSLAVAGAATWLAIRPTPDAARRAVAHVDGVPITEGDLIAEAGGPVPADQRQRLLDAVIDRRLLAAAAANDPGTRTPAAADAIRRAGETVLAGSIAQRIAGDVRADDAAARRYIAGHPAMFTDRQILLIEAGPIDPAIANGPALREAVTIDQAERALRPTGANFVHQRQVIDTGSLPAELATQLTKVAPGRLFLLPIGGRAMLGAVVERMPLVASPAIQLEQARAGAMAEIRQARLTTALKAMRAKADIRIGG